MGDLLFPGFILFLLMGSVPTKYHPPPPLLKPCGSRGGRGIKGTVAWDFRALVFFSWINSTWPLSNTAKYFRKYFDENKDTYYYYYNYNLSSSYKNRVVITQRSGDIHENIDENIHNLWVTVPTKSNLRVTIPGGCASSELSNLRVTIPWRLLWFHCDLLARV